MYNVSVITIFKNRHKKVKECLNSLINQSLDNIEIICIYKQENTQIDSFVKEAQKKHKNIKIIYKTKAQDVLAKNQALEESDGKYVLLMNGNMCLEKTAIEKMYNAVENDNTDIAICGYNIIDINSNELMLTGLENKFNKIENLDGKNINFAYLNLDGGNKLVKKEIIKDVKFENYDECQDEIFILSCYSKANKVSFINEELFYNYIDNSSRNFKNAVQVKDLKDGLVKVKTIFKDSGKYQNMKYILSFIAFSKIGLRSLIELSFETGNDLKVLIRETMNYLDINFFEWRKNPCFKFKNVPSKYFWLAHIVYKFGFQQIFIKIYKKLIDKQIKSFLF